MSETCPICNYLRDENAPCKCGVLGTSPAVSGSALLRRLQNHRAMMSPEQKQRHAGKLLLQATDEIARLIGICTDVHDRMLRGDHDMTLLRKLKEGWQGPNDGTRPEGEP